MIIIIFVESASSLPSKPSYDKTKEILALEARMRGLTPNQELHRRVEEELKVFSGLGYRYLEEDKRSNDVFNRSLDLAYLGVSNLINTMRGAIRY